MKRLFTIGLLFATILTLSACTKDKILFDIILGEEYSINVGETFYDPGFIAKDDTTDISSYVVISGDSVDTSKEGVYVITYALVYNDDVITKTRTVTVGSFNTNCDEYDDNDLMSCKITWTTYLNTVVKLTIYVNEDTTFNTNEAFSEIAEILDYYTVMSDKYEEYTGINNVYAINDQAGQTTVLDQKLYDLVKFTLAEQSTIEQFYNAALGPVLQVWHDYRENCTDNGVCAVPPISELEAQDLFTDASKIILNDTDNSITMESNMNIDLGGVSKGYVSKEIITYLDTLDIHGYLLNNGESNISIGGSHPTRENGKFIIAVTDPTYALPYYATIYLQDGEQLVTSGDYQKFYTVDGVSYHHIISPITLMPLHNSKSVSIISTDPALADLYSTAVFNMTITEGQTFVNGMDGLEAIWYGMDGTIYFSENFESNYLIDTFE